jgi:hypothetical protein
MEDGGPAKHTGTSGGAGAGAAPEQQPPEAEAEHAGAAGGADAGAAGGADAGAAGGADAPEQPGLQAATDAALLLETLISVREAPGQGHRKALDWKNARRDAKQLLVLVASPAQAATTFEGRRITGRYFLHRAAGALGLETETTNRRGIRKADVIVRKPQGWAARSVAEVAAALQAPNSNAKPRHWRRAANRAARRAAVDAWRGECYECGCALDAHAAAVSLSFPGTYCPECIELPEYNPYKWESLPL